MPTWVGESHKTLPLEERLHRQLMAIERNIIDLLEGRATDRLFNLSGQPYKGVHMSIHLTVFVWMSIHVCLYNAHVLYHNANFSSYPIVH